MPLGVFTNNVACMYCICVNSFFFLASLCFHSGFATSRRVNICSKLAWSMNSRVANLVANAIDRMYIAPLSPIKYMICLDFHNFFFSDALRKKECYETFIIKIFLNFFRVFEFSIIFSKFFQS